MSETRNTAPDLLTLHALRLKGVTRVESLVAVTGLSQAEIEGYLDQLRNDGWAELREGRMAGWTLTAAGREGHGLQVHREVVESGKQAVIAQCYHDFLPLNHAIIRLCTDWQVRDAEKGIFNDHKDPDYDAGILSRLADIHAGISPILIRLTNALSRYSSYEPRLADAQGRLRGGALEWLTRPDIQSYHTVWMELHEDLLRSLAIDRKSEAPIA